MNNKPIGNEKKKMTEIPKAQGNGKRSKKSKHGTAGLVFLTLFSVCVLTACIVCGYVLVHMISVSNGEMIINLREYQVNQNQTSIVYYRNNQGNEEELIRLHGTENRIWLNLSEIPQSIQDAFVAIEDKRFREHNGVDWYRTIAAVVKYGFKQGGSTITQQLIKNITQKKDTTFIRKFNEILSALNLEKNFSKDTILEAYLNTLYLGEGCYGVKTAVETYFGKDISQINAAEAAVLASITQAPYKFDPLVNPENNRTRQLKCLEYMLAEEKINQQEYDAAVAYPLVFTNSPGYVSQLEDTEKDEDESKVWSFYVDFIISSLIDDFMDKYGYTKQQAIQKIYYGGLKIYAAVDMNVQSIIENTYVNRITFPNESSTKNKAQSAMTIMDYTGRVVAICGEAGEKSGNRGLNRASDSPRQPGSSVKPLTAYGPAIDSNLATWSTKIQNLAFPYQGKMWPSNDNGSKGDGSYVPLQKGLARSLNTIAARIVYTIVGIDRSFAYLTEKFHITTANAVEDKMPAPLATGAMYKGVTTLEMAAAFATFGNGGKYFDPYPYYLVTNSDGSTVYFDNTSPAYSQAIGADSSEVMCELLQTVTTMSGATGVSYKIDGFQTFGKTGTTSDNKDRWFCGGTPYYVAAVWYGYDSPKAITNVSGNPAGKIFKNVLDKAHKNLPDKEFEKTSGLTVKKSYCTNTGLLAGKNCPTATGWYKVTNMPKTCTSCTGWSSGVGSTGGSLGGEETSASAEETTGILDILGGLLN